MIRLRIYQKSIFCIGMSSSYSHLDPSNNVWYDVLHAPNTRAGVVIFTDSFREFLPTALVSLAIALGGLIVSALIVKLGECFTGAQSNKHWIKGKDGSGWKERATCHPKAIIRVIMFSLAILTSVFAFWIAAQAMGVNFWTIVLSYGILGIVGTYAFGGPIKDMGAFLLISATNKIQEDWWVEVVGLGVQGRVTAIHFLWVELEYEDLETKRWEEVQIPTGYFLANVIKRKMAYENSLPDDRTRPSVKKLTDEERRKDREETAKQRPSVLIQKRHKLRPKHQEYIV